MPRRDFILAAYWKECFDVIEAETVAVNLLILSQEDDNGDVELLGEQRQQMVRQSTLQIRCLADAFGFERGVTSEGRASFFYIMAT